MSLRTITIDDIRDWNPCYDPSRYIPEGWTGTALDILRLKECPAKDRLWVVLREECIDTKTLRLFAVRCAREAMRLTGWADPRSVAACDVAERYAHGGATKTELEAARNAAWSAVYAAVRAAAARAAAYAAAYAASRAAVRASRAAAWTAYVVARAVADAADAVAREQQAEWLIEMLEGDSDDN